MPTEATPELDALEAEFMKAEEALRKARDAFEQRNTRKTRADLAVASKEYDDAGRAVRRAADPGGYLDLDEYREASESGSRPRPVGVVADV